MSSELTALRSEVYEVKQEKLQLQGKLNELKTALRASVQHSKVIRTSILVHVVQCPIGLSWGAVPFWANFKFLWIIEPTIIYVHLFHGMMNENNELILTPGNNCERNSV